MAAAAVPDRELPTDPKYDHYDFPTTSATKIAGHPGHTTPEQDAKVHQLRMMLEAAGVKERLDTLTMVRWILLRRLLSPAAHPSLPSCDSCAPASSTSSSARRCMSLLLPSASPGPDPSALLAGSSTTSNGAKSSKAASTTSSAPSSTRSAKRSSNTTRNTTTRPTRYALPLAHPSPFPTDPPPGRPPPLHRTTRQGRPQRHV